MALNRNNASPLLSPAQVEALVVRPLAAASAAAQLSTITVTDRAEVHFPTVLADPSAAWVDEASPIPLTQPVFGNVVAAPTKIGAIVVVSSETIEDSEIDPVEATGQGLVRDLARKLDLAYFGAQAAPAPSGLAALAAASGSEVQTVSAGASFTNLDAFAEGASLIEAAGGEVTGWATNPTTALALAKIKTGAGANTPLLAPGQDAAAPTRRTLEGRSLFISAAIPNGVVWGIDASTSHLVIRREARLDVDRSSFFTTDQVALRLTARMALAFTAPSRVVKITTS